MASNLTKLLNSRVRRHLKFVGFSDLNSCFSNAEFVPNQNELCRFIRLTNDCNELVKIFNYLQYMVCQLRFDKSFKGLFFMFIMSFAIIAVYMTIVFVVGRYFIVPNVLTLAERWKMSDFEFGVTALTATITLPAFLETISGCGENSGNGSMILAEVMGKLSASFSSGFITFCLKRNYRTSPKNFLFNIFVLIIGLAYVFDVMFFKINNDVLPKEQRASFNLGMHALFVLIIYIVILTLAFIKAYTKRIKLEEVEDTISNVDSLSSDDYSDAENPIEYDLDSWEIILKGSSPFNGEVRAPTIVKLFIAPIWAICAFMIPVYSKYRPLHGWCKLQAITAFVLFPICFYFVGSEPMFIASIFVCILLAVITILITHRLQEPSLHELYGVFGILAASNIYFLVDSEMDSILWQLVNFLLDWKNDVALLISSPLAQIILVSVLTYCLVEKGHASMAYGMIFGIAMFFTFTCLPLMVVQSCQSKDIKTTITSSTESTFYYLLNIYIMIFFGCSMSNFELRKSLGIAVLLITIAYLVFTCLSASWLVHPYGCQHTLYVFANVIDAPWA